MIGVDLEDVVNGEDFDFVKIIIKNCEKQADYSLDIAIVTTTLS